MDIKYLIMNSHFIVNHFPIVLLIVSFFFDLVGAIWKRKDWHTAGFLTLILGTLGAIAAVITGPEDPRQPLFHLHDQFGTLTMSWAIVLSVVRLFFRYIWKKVDIGKNPFYLLGSLIVVLLVSYTGHLGGQMVHPSSEFNPTRAGGFQPRQGNEPGQQPGQGGQQRRQGGSPGSGGGQAPGSQTSNVPQAQFQ